MLFIRLCIQLWKRGRYFNLAWYGIPLEMLCQGPARNFFTFT